MTLAEFAAKLNEVGNQLGGNALVLISKGDQGAQLDEASVVKVIDMIHMLETVRRPAEPGFTSMNVVKGELYFPGEWAEKFCAGKYKVEKVIVIE